MLSSLVPTGASGFEGGAVAVPVILKTPAEAAASDSCRGEGGGTPILLDMKAGGDTMLVLSVGGMRAAGGETPKPALAEPGSVPRLGIVVGITLGGRGIVPRL